MTLDELREAWQKARDGQKYTLEERFQHATGILSSELANRQEDWKIWRTTEKENLARRHSLPSKDPTHDPETDLFLAFLLEFYWPSEEFLPRVVVERRVILRLTALYLIQEEHSLAGVELDRMIANEIRLGHENLWWVMADPFPVGLGDPREHKPWPPEEDCPGCPSGRKDVAGVDGRHKFSCSHNGAYAMKIPVNLRTGEDLHRETAAAIFGVPKEQVTEEQRRSARSDFGLVHKGLAEGE